MHQMEGVLPKKNISSSFLPSPSFFPFLFSFFFFKNTFCKHTAGSTLGPGDRTNTAPCLSEAESFSKGCLALNKENNLLKVLGR